MASVTKIQTTGDNDEPIFPEQQVVHYMYCDNCGSFSLTDWLEPANVEQLLRQKKRAIQVRNAALAVSLVTVFLAIFDMPIFLFLSLMVMAGAAAVSSYLDRKMHLHGVICENCRITYVNGSTFFTKPENNPRQYTMADVPRPLYTVYQVKGGNPNS